LVDVTDVIDSQKAEFHPTALTSSRFYNSKLKKHAFYTVPIKCSTLMEQVWRPLIEEAGFSDADMPKTHDAYFDFFQTVQDKLRQLSPRTDAQRSLQSQALSLSDDLAQTRWLLIAESESPIPTLLLAVLIFWIAIIFLSFALFAPRNATVLVTLLVCALSVSIESLSTIDLSGGL